jgi:hypothetical protein
VTDEVTGSWWRVWMIQCGLTARVDVQTWPDPVLGSAEEAEVAFFASVCTGASSQEWFSALLTVEGDPALEVDSIQMYNAIGVSVWDNLTPDYDGFQESFFDSCPEPARHR